MRRLTASSVLKALVSSCLIATSVLNASENTEVLIMKASDNRNESFRLGLAKGPHCISVHQTTNAETISATVAVSRGPFRSETHSNGTTMRKTSASRLGVWCNKGLKA